MMLVILNFTLVIFSLLYSFYTLWQIISWIKVPEHLLKPQVFKTKVSVIIPCRNEEKNIATCLKAIIRQNYPISLFEIIVVDDHSTDGTIEIAQGILRSSSFSWQYIQSEENQFGKKNAITSGIEASFGELIVITDGDCSAGQNWIASIVSLYEENNFQMICGPVAIINESNFLECFQSLEVAGLSILAGGGTFSKNPLLCNGANLAYAKTAFETVKGFQGIDSIPTGDDTLLLFKINKEFPGQVGYLKNEESIVYTPAQPSLKGFLQQRIRWASKGFISKNRLNSFIGTIVFVTNFLLFMYLVGSFIYFSINWVFINCLILKFAVDFLLLYCATDFFNKKRLLLYFLISEFVTMVYVSWIGLTASFTGYSWKEREY
jgi:cellulose synthase/poly-beta-1,6-N-acetylglucosamine synthase-like glycosyltransferase